MTWLAVKLFLQSIPLRVWAILAAVVLLAASGLYLRAHYIGVGEGRVQALWDAAVLAQQAESDRQQVESDKAAQDATQAGQEAVTTTREETGHAAETVRTIIRERIVHVDAGCRAAVPLPGSVQAQGREAVARARGALPAAPNR